MARGIVVICAVILPFLNGVSAHAQTADENNLWVMWERLNKDSNKSNFRSHLMLNVPPDQARVFFNNLKPSALAYGAADIHHETSPLCLAQSEDDAAMISVDTSGMEAAQKIDTLRGLKGVYVDFRAVRGPRTFTRNFGAEAQGYVVKALQDAGIPMLDKDALAKAPGNPTLTLRYSSEVTGCRPWSLSLGLKQKTVLARDLKVMLIATTWSTAARQSEEDLEYDVLRALQDAVDAFTTDYAKANSVRSENAIATVPAN